MCNLMTIYAWYLLRNTNVESSHCLRLLPCCPHNEWSTIKRHEVRIYPNKEIDFSKWFTELDIRFFFFLLQHLQSDYTTHIIGVPALGWNYENINPAGKFSQSAMIKMFKKNSDFNYNFSRDKYQDPHYSTVQHKIYNPYYKVSPVSTLSTLLVNTHVRRYRMLEKWCCCCYCWV